MFVYQPVWAVRGLGFANGTSLRTFVYVRLPIAVSKRPHCGGHVSIKCSKSPQKSPHHGHVTQFLPYGYTSTVVVAVLACRLVGYHFYFSRYILTFHHSDLYADWSGAWAPRGPLSLSLSLSAPRPPPPGRQTPHLPRDQKRSALPNFAAAAVTVRQSRTVGAR